MNLYGVQCGGLCFMVVAAETELDAQQIYRDYSYPTSDGEVLRHFAPVELDLIECCPWHVVRIGRACGIIGEGVIDRLSKSRWIAHQVENQDTPSEKEVVH